MQPQRIPQRRVRPKAASFVAMYLCGYLALWLRSSVDIVSIWLCGYVAKWYPDPDLVEKVGGWGVSPNWEILMGLACVIPSLGLWISISAPGCRQPVPFGWGWCLTLLRNQSNSGSVRSWMIPGSSWMSSGVYEQGFL